MDHSASSTRRDRQGSKSQAGSTLRRASQASLANGSRRPGWLHAPACEDSKPGNNFSTQHGAGRVQKRGERQQENLESQAGSTPQRANQGTVPQSYCQSRGSTLRRANTASLAIVFKKNGPFSQQHQKRHTRIQKPGWLHAPACEPSQLGKWIQKAGLAPRSGVRRQQARL